jgi:hypothetical protein
VKASLMGTVKLLGVERIFGFFYYSLFSVC